MIGTCKPWRFTSSPRPLQLCVTSLLVGCFLLISQAKALTIEEAYKSIPQHQTTYSQSSSTLSKESAASLEEFFHLVDLAIVDRVEALQILRTSRGRVEKQITDLRRLGHRLREFKLPDECSEVARLVGNAIMDQVNYLNSIAKGNRMDIQQFSGDLRIKSASDKLRQAQTLLQKAFPKESEENRQAFHDHLRAMDFL